MWFDPKPYPTPELPPEKVTISSEHKRHLLEASRIAKEIAAETREALRRKVINAIMKSRASINSDDISDRTGLRPQYVRELIRELMRDGVIERDMRQYFRPTNRAAPATAPK